MEKDGESHRGTERASEREGATGRERKIERRLESEGSRGSDRRGARKRGGLESRRCPKRIVASKRENDLGRVVEYRGNREGGACRGNREASPCGSGGKRWWGRRFREALGAPVDGSTAGRACRSSCLIVCAFSSPTLVPPTERRRRRRRRRRLEG